MIDPKQFAGLLKKLLAAAKAMQRPLLNPDMPTQPAEPLTGSVSGQESPPAATADDPLASTPLTSAQILGNSPSSLLPSAKLVPEPKLSFLGRDAIRLGELSLRMKAHGINFPAFQDARRLVGLASFIAGDNLHAWHRWKEAKDKAPTAQIAPPLPTPAATIGPGAPSSSPMPEGVPPQGMPTGGPFDVAGPMMAPNDVNVTPPGVQPPATTPAEALTPPATPEQAAVPAPQASDTPTVSQTPPNAAPPTASPTSTTPPLPASMPSDALTPRFPEEPPATAPPSPPVVAPTMQPAPAVAAPLSLPAASPMRPLSDVVSQLARMPGSAKFGLTPAIMAKMPEAALRSMAAQSGIEGAAQTPQASSTSVFAPSKLAEQATTLAGGMSGVAPAGISPGQVPPSSTPPWLDGGQATPMPRGAAVPSVAGALSQAMGASGSSAAPGSNSLEVAMRDLTAEIRKLIEKMAEQARKSGEDEDEDETENSENRKSMWSTEGESEGATHDSGPLLKSDGPVRSPTGGIRPTLRMLRTAARMAATVLE